MQDPAVVALLCLERAPIGGPPDPADLAAQLKLALAKMMAVRRGHWGSTTSGGTRIVSDAIFISNASIFLPRYSGVRPTISPARNTATMANISMP